MKFSIVVPVYNVAPYLRECLDSILAQTHREWECICVDDGSTDGSGLILDEYGAKDSRLKVFHQENAGVSAARNTALKAISGHVVSFVDADDVLSPEWLSLACEWIAKTDADILRMGFTPFANERPSVSAANAEIIYEVSGADKVLSWGVGKLLKNGHLWRGFYKREVVNGFRFPVGVRMMEDCAFQMWTLTKAKHIVELNYPGYLYRQRTTSAVHSLPKDAVKDKLLYFAELRRWFVANRAYFVEHRVLSHVQVALWRAVFESTKDAVIQYRTMQGRMNEYTQLAMLLRAMKNDGAFGMTGVPLTWKLPMGLFVGWNAMIAMLLRWKLSAAWSKFSEGLR